MHRRKKNSKEVEEVELEECTGVQQEEGKASHLCCVPWQVKQEHTELNLLNLVMRMLKLLYK